MIKINKRKFFNLSISSLLGTLAFGLSAAKPKIFSKHEERDGYISIPLDVYWDSEHKNWTEEDQKNFDIILNKF